MEEVANSVMGATINIGFVKSDITTLNATYDCLINFLYVNGMKIKSIKFSTDDNGFNWKEISNPNDSESRKFVHQLMYHCEFKVTNFLFHHSFIDVIIRLTIHEDDYYSIMIEIEEAFIINSYEINELEFVESFIVNFMKNTLRKLKMEYAFSSQDAEVEFSPEKFKKLTKPYYALEAKYNNNDKIIISKAHWYINGLTERGS